jgi:tight adherence protein C
MLEVINAYADPTLVIPILVGIALFATILTVALPFVEAGRLKARMKAVASERERLRARMRQEMEKARSVRLRHKPRPFMARVVDQLKLRSLLETDNTRHRLRMAGLRSERHLITFLFLRTVLPILFGALALVYLYSFIGHQIHPALRTLITLGAAFFGFFLPNILVENMIQRRQESIKAAWSDALDLLLICVEAGMSIESALQRVAREIGGQSVALAEELTLTHAELSYLPERRKAFENLANRTGLVTVKAATTSMIQAERYGSSIGQTLRVLAQENRDLRMSEAERKAAALPPKLTVPMVVFFLPVIFIVILGPAFLRAMKVM